MGKVSIESLSAFMACVDNGGFSKAAIALKKSQATISILISNLEDDLQITLFDRSSRSPKLTEHGQHLYPYVRNIILAQQDLLNASGELLNHRESSVTLLMTDYIPAEQRELLKEQFRSHIEGIKLTVLSAESNNVESMLLHRKADIALIPAMKSRMNYPSELTGRRTWFTAALHVYCAASHPLMQQEQVNEHSIKGMRRIRLTRGTTTNKSPRNDILTDDVFRAYRLCTQGLGWCELPEWVVNAQALLGDTALKIVDVAPSTRTLEFDVLYRNEPKGRFVNWFIQAVTDKNQSVSE
ncbi:LysR family transcriptional regulator [Salmonella enterica]